jgi:hypothetical protein
MISKVTFLIYQAAKYVYRKIPFPNGTKARIDYKLISLIERISPGTFSLSNKSVNRIVDFKAMNYDVNTDKIGSTLLQNIYFPKDLESAENIMIIIIPYFNVMSGGIYSLFSIAETAIKLKQKHGWDVLVMTYPNPAELTYYKNIHFKSSIDVFRFSQITRLIKTKKLYIHIPECFVASFLNDISTEQKKFLATRSSTYLNILNQNIDLMPEPKKILKLKSYFNRVSQSVAHHAYFSKTILNKYKIDLHLLPAYTNLAKYSLLPLHKKEKIIIYSPDKAPYKNKCISILKNTFPDFKFVEIKDISFDKFIDLASRCMFSITFGEGFDGYLSQPMQLGGVGFAIYNKRFFPSLNFLNLYNIFRSEEAFQRELPIRIKKLLANPKLYKSTNSKFLRLHSPLYNKKEYELKILKLCKLELDLKSQEV